METPFGSRYAVRPGGTIASISAPGRTVNFRSDGRVSSISAANMQIDRGMRGERIVRTVRPDRSVLVGTGGRNGYLERTVVVQNRTIIQRTYVVNRRVFVRGFSTYPVMGVVLPLYFHPLYFSPAFYGWAFYPWATPVPYAWGWGGAPWFGYYGGYYQPFPVYPGPAAWLTDYYLSQMFASAYAMQTQAPPPPPAYGGNLAGAAPAGNPGGYANQPADGELYARNDTPITPELHNAIAEEVSRQLAYENAIASKTAQPAVEELPNSLKPDRVFVVATTIDVSTLDGQACELTVGDVLRVTAPPQGDNPTATLRVASGKRQDCPAGVEVAISLQDLAEMQNNLRAQMDAGLDALRNGQGQGGLPRAPQSAMAAPPQPAGLDVPLPPDPNVASLLDAQQQEAQRTEQTAVQSVTAINQ